ncbi:Heparan-alpha-glucosaminide N-acetyltransferase [Exaiptasia diaphana]|nr:Heparan-alpha-glucosaminide N-acetyltransferase [Exaiptasia diaphana]
MLFVNFGHGGYYFFGHADWNGLQSQQCCLSTLVMVDIISLDTLTGMCYICPFTLWLMFIWIMGVSITLSFKSLARKKLKPFTVLKKIIRRSLILFGLGVFTSNFNDLEYYRVPGVLQRFAICYFVIAVMQLYLPPREDLPKRWWDPIRDVVAIWKQWLVMAFVLVVFLLVTYGVKVGHCPTPIKRMEFEKKDIGIDLKSHTFILTIRNILRTNEANTEHWRIRNWIIKLSRAKVE